MEVGKKYKGSFGYEFECVALTPGGNAVFKENGRKQEFICNKEHFAQYTEVVEPVVRYVRWYKTRTGEIRMVSTRDEELPRYLRIGNGHGYTHLKTEKVEYRG